MVKWGLDLLDLLADNDRIILAYLILPELLVVELAVVFVRVAMLPTVETAAPTVESGEAHFTLARLDTAPRAFFLLGGGRCDARCARLCRTRRWQTRTH